jgi:hypothetical protein
MLYPIGIIEDISIVETELARMFNVTCKREKRMVKTLVLVRTSEEEKFKTHGGEQAVDIIKGVYTNISMSAILSPLYKILPSLDETGYTGKIDVTLGVNVQSKADLPAFRKALQRYDLDLKEEMRELEMFVITEIKK